MSSRTFSPTAAAVLLACLHSLSSSAAQAQDPAVTAEARAAVQEGARLFEKKEYEAALAKFQAAYSLVLVPKLQYNFGLTYLALGRKPDAYEAFDAFLRDTSDPPPVQKLKAAQQLETLRKEVLLVSLSCNVDEAKVIIDGRLRGSTPLKSHLPLDPGSHELVIEREDTHEAIRQVLSGAAGEKLTLSLTMKEKALATTAPMLSREPAPAPVPMISQTPADPEPKPFYTRAWFWVGVGVVAVAATTAALLLTNSSTTTFTCPASTPDCYRI